MATGTADRDDNRHWVNTVFDTRVFVATFVVIIVVSIARAVIPLVGELTGFTATAVVAFAYGTRGRHAYAEIGAASALAAGVMTLTDPLALLLGYGIPQAVLAASIGVVVGVVAHYLGRDLRDGFTREV